MEEPPHPGAAAAAAAAAAGGGGADGAAAEGGGAGAGEEGFLDAGEVSYTPSRPAKVRVREWLCLLCVSLGCVSCVPYVRLMLSVISSPILSG